MAEDWEELDYDAGIAAKGFNIPAPWSGGDVLLGWFLLPGQDRMEVGRWHSWRHSWIVGGEMELTGTDPNWRPTHWRDLPAPPTNPSP